MTAERIDELAVLLGLDQMYREYVATNEKLASSLSAEENVTPSKIVEKIWQVVFQLDFQLS